MPTPLAAPEVVAPQLAETIESSEPSTETSETADTSETASSNMVAAAASDNVGASAGDVMVEARYDAAYLHNPQPPYPSMSKSLREEGTVMLRVHVLSDGKAEQVDIKQSSGSRRLDEAARASVSRWRFLPARRGSEAVASWVLVPITFHLEP
ncbi:MAG: energy transducer TonB [Azoarcus sp.]|jgi:protein TonB|nr:energy transducer TonB [Azoarcus sp.]